MMPSGLSVVVFATVGCAQNPGTAANASMGVESSRPTYGSQSIAKSSAQSKIMGTPADGQSIDGIFRFVDTNRDGRLSYGEMMTRFPFGEPQGGWEPGKKEKVVLDTLALGDFNRSGTIENNEFGALVPDPKPPASKRELFDRLDADRNGRLTILEMLYGPFGMPVGGWKPGQKEKAAWDTVQRIDSNRDGALDYSEFDRGMPWPPISRN